METPAEQRQRLYAKRMAETDEPLIKCLECSLAFIRVGSHVVQVHGYGNVAEYRLAHGLKATETSTAGHRQKMNRLNKSVANLTKGANNRFKKGGEHGAVVSQYWASRKLHKNKELQK